MGRIYDRIDEHQQAWIAKQSMFFVGTAPSGDEGHINVSPKGPIGSLGMIGKAMEVMASSNRPERNTSQVIFATSP